MEDKNAFKRMKAIEQRYARSLRQVASEIGRIIEGFNPLDGFASLNQLLIKYSEILKPWAAARGALMVGEVNHQSKRQWREATKNMGIAIREEIQRAPTGIAMRQMMSEQVTLITSLPIKAAERVHKLVTKGISGSMRAEEVAKEIARSGEVTKSRATLIARTETARAQASLTQARAEHVGATSYIWRTAEDEDVRPMHKRLDGKVFQFNNPPLCDPGIHANPGETYNCRCVALPIIPKTIT